MTARRLPPPVSVTDIYLQAVLDTQTAILGELRALRADQALNSRRSEPEDGTVELTEPAAPKRSTRKRAGS